MQEKAGEAEGGRHRSPPGRQLLLHLQGKAVGRHRQSRQAEVGRKVESSKEVRAGRQRKKGRGRLAAGMGKVVPQISRQEETCPQVPPIYHHQDRTYQTPHSHHSQGGEERRRRD